MGRVLDKRIKTRTKMGGVLKDEIEGLKTMKKLGPYSEFE
jgi:hypothetical protein